VYDKRKDVDSHLATAHPDQKTPYGCTLCTATFSTEKAAKYHAKRHDRTNANEDIPDSKRQRVVGECPFVGTVSEWVSARYNPTRATVVEQMSQATLVRIEGFAVALRFEKEQTLVEILGLADDGLIVDIFDNWMDLEFHTYALQTVNNHVRYLKILLLFHQDHLDSPEVDETIIEYITDLVVDTQTTATRSVTTLNVLKLEDPFALTHIRDTIVNALLKEQVEQIHPYILSSVLDGKPGATHSEFGPRLRNWLELVIRFTNIPCRIQCTRELQMPDETAVTYVSKLVLRDGQYCRLINQDKTAESHQPLLIPLGHTLSTYLYFYMTYCRPQVEHSFVFCTRRGTKWVRPSRDLKRYIEEVLEIPVHQVDPTGRFIHGSRSIMMAVFAVGVNFDQQKMHGFARLMRHSSTTNERYYSMWQQRALSNQSIDVFSQLMGLDFTSTTVAPVAYQPVKLREVPARMRSVFVQGFGSDVSRSNVEPCYGTCSVGTQTGPSQSDECVDTGLRMYEMDVADTVPRCTACGLFTLELYGPFGSMRRKRYVGRYYLACGTCHRNDEGRFNLPQCLWYPLGYVPLQKSNSSRPRNMKEIQSFIASSHHPREIV
jgi:hypothetical protein